MRDISSVGPDERKWFIAAASGLLTLALFVTGVNATLSSGLLGNIAKWLWFFTIFGIPGCIWMAVIKRRSRSAASILIVVGGTAATVLVHGLSFSISEQGLLIMLRGKPREIYSALFIVIIFASFSYFFSKLEEENFQQRATGSPSDNSSCSNRELSGCAVEPEHPAMEERSRF